MSEYEREEMLRDAQIDSRNKKYRVLVPVMVIYETTAENQDDAEGEAYDAVRDTLRGSHLDYDFGEIEGEEIDDGRPY